MKVVVVIMIVEMVVMMMCVYVCLCCEEGEMPKGVGRKHSTLPQSQSF